MNAALNNDTLCRQLQKALPESVFIKVDHVFGRVHWLRVDVAFIKPGGGYHTVRINKSDWLNDASIARLCLECP